MLTLCCPGVMLGVGAASDIRIALDSIIIGP
jgi:hypothetical protein